MDVRRAVLAAALVFSLAGCGGDDGGGGGSGDGGTGRDLATVDVTVAPAAFVDARPDGGAELTGVTFTDPAKAVCRAAASRVGVIPEAVDEAKARTWTNATDQPVVYLLREDVEGDYRDLPICSQADDRQDMETSLLHGRHVHSAHD